GSIPVDSCGSLEVEKDLVFPVHEHLYGKYRGVLKEKRVKSFFAGFDVTLDPVVVRASHHVLRERAMFRPWKRFRYSRRRKCLRQLFSQLIENNNSYAIDFCQLIAKVGKSL
ncbi:MAG: hypothetical protein ABIH45_00265, partial [Candidatus Omnitrophota bacterium]